MFRQVPRCVAPGLMASILPASEKCCHDPAKPATGASDRGQRHGKAEELGQGVQPQPRNRSRPSAFDFGRGEPTDVAQRQRSTRPQAPSVGRGAKPRPPSEARLPLACLRAAQVGHEVSEGAASSRAYFSPSWTAFQADRGRCFSGIVDDVNAGQEPRLFAGEVADLILS